VFLGYALIGVFAFGTLFAYISASSFVVQEILGLDSTAYTLVFGANALSTTLVSALSMRLVSRVPVRRLLDVGVTWLVSVVCCWGWWPEPRSSPSSSR
jgi:DHA1 family bicyclomycin/chloramphenicol resistance-like MFS transporter